MKAYFFKAILVLEINLIKKVVAVNEVLEDYYEIVILKFFRVAFEVNYCQDKNYFVIFIKL